MKKSITGVVLLILFLILMFLSFGRQVGAYVSFEEARESGRIVSVVGTLDEGKPTRYNARSNEFSFYLRDEEGRSHLVGHQGPKPVNFDEAEKIVVKGRTRGDVFWADHILIKCPSKYNEAPALETS